MINAAEILRKVTEERETEDNSQRTHYEVHLLNELRTNIDSVLPEAYKTMLDTLCDVYDNLCNENFEDGTLYGMKIVTSMQSLCMCLQYCLFLLVCTL